MSSVPPLLFWDASSLVKRYYTEGGSGTVNAVFAAVPPRQMFGTVWGYAECFWILRRKRNEKRLSENAFAQATLKLEQEVLTSGDFRLFSIEDDRVLAGLGYVVRDSLNSNDGAILATYMRYLQSLPPNGPTCVLIAADGRLLRAAQAEGFVRLNPELVAEPDVPAFLARL